MANVNFIYWEVHILDFPFHIFPSLHCILEEIVLSLGKDKEEIINIINVFRTAGSGSAPADRAAHHPHEFSYNTVPGSSKTPTIIFSNCKILQVGRIAFPINPIKPGMPKFRCTGAESPKFLIWTVPSLTYSATSRLPQNSERKNTQNGVVFRKCPQSQRANPWDLSASEESNSQQP